MMFYTRIILSLIIVIFSGEVIGQNFDFNKFERLESQGKIPDEFLTLTSEKYAVAKEDENLQKKGKKKVVDEFILKSNYSIDKLLQGGKVLFNDPVSNYINDVADELLKDDISLRRNLRFYLIKSNVTNAFSTNQGIIFLTTGLISQLANEAQLAFIIGHEISHYIKEHVIDGYIEKDAAKNSKGDYKKSDYDEKIKALSTYSKEKEMEADLGGAEIYLKSDYDFKAMVSTFDVLQFSHLPFDDVKWSSDFLTSEQLFIPEGVFVDSINQIKFDDDYDDSESSHPNIKTRRTNLLSKYDKDNFKEGKLYIVSEQRFKEARDLCRFESVRSFNINAQYGKAIYSIFLLKRNYPNNPFLDLSLVKAFYGLAKYKNIGLYYDITESPKDIEGESYPLHQFLRNSVSKEMINAFAYRLAYDMMKKHKGNESFKVYEELLFEELVNHSDLDYADLKSLSYKEALDQEMDLISDDEYFDPENEKDSTDEDSNEEDGLSKYEKIRQKIGVNEDNEKIEIADSPSKNNFYLFAFSDLKNSPKFKSKWEKIKKDYEEQKEAEENKDKLSYKDAAKRSNKIRRHGLKLGIEKVVVVDPMFERYDLRKDQNLPLVSEKTKITLSNSYLQSASLKGLNVDIIDPKMMGPVDIDKFNELSLLNDWLSERLNHDEDLNFYCSTTSDMDRLRKKYNTDYFLFSSLLSARIPKDNLGGKFLLAAIIWYYMPFVIIDAIIPENECLFTFALFNVANGDIEFIDSRSIQQKHNEGLINAHVYDVIYQINSTKK